MIIKENEAWKYFYESEEDMWTDIPNCGKWMYFFKLNDAEIVDKLILKAMELKVCTTIKRTVDSESVKIFNPISSNDSGVVCFYLSIDDTLRHKKVIQFFLDNNMIKTTKTGKLFNISFKLDDQTDSMEYSKYGNFQAKLKLENILDLETREWKI
ncbi:hypothetical protein [Ureaplasma canigenitalium]|uniref:hypothetical protein n=1 Tax=Ureaplasma canigenitalium TaxID=42092 RepID=UPI0004E0E31B|nr:hypothetical protein [Ureaplasma canigenitalium]